MELRKIGRGNPDFYAMLRIYEEAFPECERNWTEGDMLTAPETPSERVSTEILGIYLDEAPDELVGFFLTLVSDTAVYIYYFAIRHDFRSKGIGAKALKAIMERYGEKTLILDYESIYQESDNPEQRKSRHAFYMRNGFHETDYLAEQDGVELIIACSSKDFRKEDYELFMAESPASVDKANPVTIPFLRPDRTAANLT